MKAFYVRTMLLLAMVIGLGACASTEEVATGDNTLKTGGAVPGEKTADEPMSATAGPGVAGAGVHW
ncbi:MAG TPA: hypothetical protein VGM62_07625 [Chthoniobacterales bacterium]|jgi:hypothetical protein